MVTKPLLITGFVYRTAMDSLGCITGDTGINKGGIIFIVTGANCFHPHTYINLHRLHSQPPYFGWVGIN